MSNLGEKLKLERMRINLTCEEVAVQLGFNKGEISRYENNVRRPNVETLVALAKLYGCSTDYLLGHNRKNA